MQLSIDHHSDVPVYRQIETFFREGILSGGLPENMRLPAARQLASDLGVNRLTVENAYAELKADGLIASRQGSGTFVLPVSRLQPVSKEESFQALPDWQAGLQEKSTQGVRQRDFDRYIASISHADLIRLDSNPLDAGFFPVDEFRKVMGQVLREDGLAALDYVEFQGYPPLRSTIAKVLTSDGLPAHPDHILITSGSQQAISLTAQYLVRPGEVVLVESPTYTSALDLFNAMGCQVVGIPMDEHGMKVDCLEALIREHAPRLIYCIPNFQNPTGACLSDPRRRQLLSLAGEYGIPILEDDFVGDLRYDGRGQPTLKALDPGGQVIYVSTFSKMLMPGLRVGFLLVEGPVYEGLANTKRVSDLTTSTLLQRALNVYVTIGRYQAHLQRSRRVYRQRRDAIVEAVRQYLPEEVSFHIPKGGLFLWLRLPEGISAADLLPRACRAGVSFVPGNIFFPDENDGRSFLRLGFAAQTPERIQEGIKRLGEVFSV